MPAKTSAERSELFQDLRRKFLEGKSVREIARANGLSPTETYMLIAYISREFDVERMIRTDQTMSTFMELVQRAADDGKADEAKQWMDLFLKLSRDRDVYMRTKYELKEAPKKKRTNTRAVRKAEEKASQNAADDAGDFDDGDYDYEGSLGD